MNIKQAQAAAERVREYWRERGCQVDVKVTSEFKDRAGHVIYGLRSDMVSGLPREVWEERSGARR